MELVIRPRPGRQRKALVTVAAVGGLLLLCAGVKVADNASLSESSPVGPALAVLALALVPLAVLGVLARLNVRNVQLRASQGQLFSTDWTGRTVTLVRPTVARLMPVSSTYGVVGQLLVISDWTAPVPAVLVPQWWRDEDLQQLFDVLDLTVVEEQPMMLGELIRAYGSARLPWSLRHPLLFTGSVLLPVAAYIGAIVLILNGV